MIRFTGYVLLLIKVFTFKKNPSVYIIHNYNSFEDLEVKFQVRLFDTESVDVTCSVLYSKYNTVRPGSERNLETNHR